MKTDELFYELFKIDPNSLFRLARLTLDGVYAFESVTVKTTEKRIDGLCQRTDGVGPNIFLEIQGYNDVKIYWRALREVSTYYEQRDDSRPFILIVLFLDPEFDPGPPPFLTASAPHQFLRLNLAECFETLMDAPGVLTVLKPLFLDKQEIVRQAQQWKSEIAQLPLSEAEKRRVMALLEYALRQRFAELSEQEVRAMLHLLPLEETVAGQELMKISRQEGITMGELIGEIRLAQRVLKLPISSTDELSKYSPNILKAMLRELEGDLATLN